MLDGPVAAINSALEVDFQIERPKKLSEMKRRFSEGQKTMGRGFELTSSERANLLMIELQANEVIVPLFTGQDVNNMPELVP